MNSLTTDTFFDGRIQIKQPRSGYRFSIDSVILAYHAQPRPDDKVVDLGTGCGIIPLILAYRDATLCLYGIEVQPELAEIAALNVRENHMDDRVQIFCRDMKVCKTGMISGPADLIVSNPPYRKAESGRINPDQQRAVARHEIKTTLTDVIQTAQGLLRHLGRFITIYTAERVTDLLTQMRSASLEPKFLRMIHSVRDTEAKLILVEGIKGGGRGSKTGPPLIIYQHDGSYTEEMEKMFEP
jgi:tRNA1Val (adenine37-N6)-methyltransferase